LANGYADSAVNIIISPVLLLVVTLLWELSDWYIAQ